MTGWNWYGGVRRAVATVAAAGAVLAAGVGFAPAANAIYDGHEVNVAQFPFTVRLESPKGRCGGTLIARSWVLTAAHCMLDKDGNLEAASRLRVYVGVTSSSPTQSVSKINVNPQFNRDTGAYDGALLHLRKPSWMPPVALASTDPAPGARITYLGWGCTSLDQTNCQPSNTLQRGNSTVRPDAFCRPAISTPTLATSYFCTARKEGATYLPTPRGEDSGGPALVRVSKHWHLAGVISQGNNYSDATASVPALQPWIRSVLATGPH